MLSGCFRVQSNWIGWDEQTQPAGSSAAPLIRDRFTWEDVLAAPDDPDAPLSEPVLGVRSVAHAADGDRCRDAARCGQRRVAAVGAAVSRRWTTGHHHQHVGMLSLRVAGKSPDALVFTTLRGQQLRSQNFARRVWAPAVAAASLGPLRLHEMRHTAVSIAVSSGADVLAVARMLGHADPSITLKRYAGLLTQVSTGSERRSERFCGRLVLKKCAHELS